MRVGKIVSFSVVILLITILFAGVATVPAAAQFDTMQFRYNSSHTGDYSPVAGAAASNGQLLWNDTSGDWVSSTPAIANGVVYVGGADHNVYALNANNGVQLWSYTTRNSITASPAIANGVVYVGSDDNNVYALNATTGAKLWNYTTGSYVESSPAIANGVVYVGSEDHNVYALNATTGAKLWTYTTGSLVYSSPAVINGVVFVGSNDGNLYAIGNAAAGLEALLIDAGWGFVGLVFVGLVIAFWRSGRGSVHAAPLAGLAIMRRKISAFTIVLLIWLTLYVIYRLSGISFSILEIAGALTHGGLGLLTLYYVLSPVATILYAFAIVGIVAHYYRGETASLLRWGPLCGIAGAAANVVAGVVLFYYQTPTPGFNTMTTAMLEVLAAYILVLMTGVPSYVEYLKEGAPVATERVAQAARSGRLSTALTRHIENIEVSIDRTRKRIRRDLTLLTVSLPPIFIGTIVIVAFAGGPMLLMTIVYALFGIFFLIVAVAFSSLLKKPRFVLLSVNYSDADLESIAAAERRALVKDARERLALFLLVYAFPVLFWVALLMKASLSSSLAEPTVSVAVLMLSALVCFLVGYWVLTRSAVAAISLDEPALHGLLDASVGVLPTKVHAGEAHSVLMDFNIAAASGGATLSAGDAPAFDAGSPRAHYEIELQAAGAAVDGEKRCILFDVPATLKGIWSCSFPNAGTQALHLLLHAVRPARAQTEADALNREPILPTLTTCAWTEDLLRRRTT
jgi:hypothetical protein